MNNVKENSELKIIYDVSHAILQHKDNINSLLNVVLDVLQKDMGVQRATLTLKRDNLLIIEASKGLTGKEQSRGQYKLGEGITGKVGSTGSSVIIPDITKEPSFLDRTKSRHSDEIAFVCVPIKHKEEVIGTLSIDCPPELELNLVHTRQLMKIVANLLADGVASLRNEIEERENLLAENMRLKNELECHFKPKSIIGNCNRMRAVYGMIAQVAQSQATVLIRGESGTGKELIAKAIHYASPRKDKAFIAVNCAALPENLIESELFGHERGSFTGAHAQRKGRFEVADGGTLFLDEIGDISIPVQVKLLRVLQEKVFERVGGHTPIKSNVRIIAATSRNLEENMASDKFREDLFYRLNVFPILVPSLRERKTDITLLSDYFLEKYNKLYKKQVKRISSPAINMLMAYHWPGNVRELENCIERAVLIANNDVINAFDLPPSLQTAKESKTPFLGKNDNADFITLVESFEKELIVEALKENNGNIAATTKMLGATQRIIHYKIKKLGIKARQYKGKA